MSEKREERILVIDNCQDCPNYNFDDGNDEKKWGKGWCDALDRELPIVSIPEDCPLPTEYTKSNP